MMMTRNIAPPVSAFQYTPAKMNNSFWTCKWVTFNSYQLSSCMKLSLKSFEVDPFQLIVLEFCLGHD